jgi:6-phosphogluconolactonase (cycloisomerase 2 family)
MLKKAAALFVLCASMAIWVGCSSTSSHYLYAAIPGSNQIVAYREDPNSGILTQLVVSPISAGQAVEALAMHPSGKFLYAANSGEGDVTLYTISTAGSLTEGTHSTVGTAPTLLAMDSAGSFLYVGNSGSFNISVFSIGSDGTLSAVGSPFPIGMVPINMKVAPSGNVLYVTGAGTSGFDSPGIIQAFSMNQGVPTSLSTSPYFTGNGPYGLDISSSGSVLYTANKLDNSISEFAISATDGSLTAISGSPIGETYSGPVSLFIDKSGKYLYVANQSSTNMAAYTIASDGSLTLLSTSPFGTNANPNVIAGDSGGKYLFVGNQSSSATIESFSLDTSNGTLTTVATYTVPGTPTSIVITP